MKSIKLELVIAIISACISVFGFILSYISYYQLLPLSESNVILSESSIVVTPGMYLKDTKVDDIVPHLTNIGKAAASKLQLQVLFGTFDASGLVPSFVKAYDTYVVNSLDPDTGASIGDVVVNGDAPEFTALVFCIKYFDTLEDKFQFKTFYFKHPQGQARVISMTTDDYGNIKQALSSFINNNKADNLCQLN